MTTKEVSTANLQLLRIEFVYFESDDDDDHHHHHSMLFDYGLEEVLHVDHRVENPSNEMGIKFTPENFSVNELDIWIIARRIVHLMMIAVE